MSSVSYTLYGVHPVIQNNNKAFFDTKPIIGNIVCKAKKQCKMFKFTFTIFLFVLNTTVEQLLLKRREKKFVYFPRIPEEIKIISDRNCC